MPLPFRFMAHDPRYAAEVWGAVKRAFSDHRLSRRLKEALAFAVSLTSRSPWGTAFHLRECAGWAWAHAASWRSSV